MEAGTATRTEARPRLRQLAADYFDMTKPKVQTLLLFTTVTTMYVAGTPSLELVLLTCLGGALSAGGAGAVNHAFDRDIDAVMTRTADRPVPSGRVSARAAVIYGVCLQIASFVLLATTVNVLAATLALGGFVGYVGVYTIWLKRRTTQNIVIGGAAGAVPPLVAWAAVTGSLSGTAIYLLAIVFFWTLVNPLSAFLALAGLLYYVFIYTRWLKRTTPQNIVVGGAAGAFPPLVGWAAATGEVTLTAVYLFLIVFFWTPPHFWALALVKQRDYGRVGIPMAPNVWGERATKQQMLLYTLALVPITLAPVTFGGLGLVYGIAAAALGLWFIRDVVRVMRAPDFVRPAWTLYRNSLLYLALLFAAMAVDGVVARGAEVSPGVIFLRDPGHVATVLSR